MRRLLPLLLLLLAVSAHAEGWVLEFGPYGGFYDFDRSVAFEDKGLVGLRAGVRLGGPWQIEAEFDEVYTRREISGHRARQVTLALHGRYEPLDRTFSPSLLAGTAFVALDDSEDADAFGEALDLGLGVRWRAHPRWVLRAEWMLRRQDYRIHRLDAESVPQPVEGEEQALWGRSLRVGVAHVF